MAIRELIGAVPKGGRPVVGNRLIGREKEIRRIMRDFLIDPEGHNMAVYGLPRIGKTSIVKEVLRRYLANGERLENICPAYVDLNPVKGWAVAQIYYYILNGIWEEIDDRVISDSDKEYIQGPLNEIRTNLKERNVVSSIIVTTFQNFFLRCRKRGLSLRVVLDEYDSVMPSFVSTNGVLDSVGLNAFNGAMRNIIDEDKYDTRILFITRNRLSEMEPESVSSRLTGVCGEPLMIKPFSQEDVEEYWTNLIQYDTEGLITEAHKDKIAYYAGSNYPYWMNLVNSILFNALYNEKSESDTVLDVAITIRDEYKSVLDMLDASRYLDGSDGTLRSKLFQAVLGIQYDLQPADIDRLMNYGVLEKHGDNDYRAISPFFHDYIDYHNMQTPVWKHLGRFEKSMRSLIKMYISETGSTIEDGNLIPSGLLGELKKRRNRMCSNFGDTSVSHDLVDYFFTSNYFDLFVKPFWAWFNNVFVSFHGDLDKCAEQFHCLEQCRNAEGHFNGQFLSKEMIARVEQYCITLSEQAENYLAQRVQ